MHSYPLRTLCALLALAMAGLAAPVPAAQVEGLYRAEVGSADLVLLDAYDGEELAPAFDSRQARREALMRAALARVLIRLSGTSQVAADPLVQAELLASAEGFVNRYQFVGSGSSQPRLRVQFNGQAVREALWKTGWPVWGRYRPGVVVWVAQRGAGGLNLASPDVAPELFKALRETAERYGLPLLVPLMDSMDRRRLSGRDLLFEDWNRIRSASERYDPDAVLLLRLGSPDSGSSNAEWVLRRNGEVRTFTTGGEGPEAAFRDGLKRILARLACDYAVFPGQPVTMQAAVDGIRDLQEYARVERGLARLAAIDSVTPVRVDGEQARFRFHFQGPVEGADHILGLLDLLEPRQRPDTEETEDRAPLHFTYRP
ncbi:DUF2066 domain-containing protein [Thiohalorhabdus methylotrophus]|uniref:DUF2066 domain-containing protein n=1 Tax=Thiohalorhabdus methylotrophus TaxID=3242694 RepID=A0ABV4TQ17_9GAMM